MNKKPSMLNNYVVWLMSLVSIVIVIGVSYSQNQYLKSSLTKATPIISNEEAEAKSQALICGQNGATNSTGNGQDSNLSQDAKKQKAEELNQLMNEALSTPPEVAADTLFQLIEAGLIDKVKKKRELLEELFNLAYSAKHKLKRIDSNPLSDTRSGSLAYGLSLNLDTLSLQCRSVKNLIVIDKQKAKELFKRISIPELTPLSCEESLVFDPSIYYYTLTDIIQRAFTNEEKQRKEHVDLIAPVINRINSPLQLSPALKAINSLDAAPDDLSYLVQRISKKMAGLSGDSRSFLWSTRSLGADVKELASNCKSKGVLFDSLIDSYRSFLLNHMVKNWCDDYKDRSQIVAMVKKESDYFNTHIASLVVNERANTAHLKVSELLPKGVDKPAHIYKYWDTPSAQKLLKGAQNLNFDAGDEKRSMNEREQPAWQKELSNFYNSLRGWTKDSEMSEVDYFHQKCGLFGFLLEAVPKSNPQYDNILSDYIDFLAQNRTQQESIAEWLWQARVSFLRMKFSKQSADDITKRYTESSDDILRTIAKTKLFIAKYK